MKEIKEMIDNMVELQHHFNGMVEAYQKLLSTIRQVTIEDAITVLGSMYEQMHIEILEMRNKI